MSAERSVNWYVEAAGVGTPRVKYALYPTPGLKLFAWVPNGPIRALFAQDGRVFCVSGTTFFELLSNRTGVARGYVDVDNFPATISSSGQGGNQLFITSAGTGYIFNLVTSAFTKIVDADFPDPVVSGLYFDGSFIALEGGTGAFFLSDPEDGLTWSGLDFGIEVQFSDTVVAMTKTHDNLWLFGTRNTGPWYNSGDSSFAYKPIPGSLIEHGIQAPWSAVELDNTVFWLGQDENGGGVVWRADGYRPVKVSSTAVDFALSQATNLSQAIAWGYQQQGHIFLMLYVPSLPTTWVYDVTTQLWHERGVWDTRLMQYVPDLGRCHCFGFERNLVGDRQSGAVYAMSLDYPSYDVVLA